MDLAELNRVANALVTPGKGVLAADESAGTVKKRFDVIGVECTEDNRRDYRELLFRSKGMANISGVILFDETIRQKAKDGTPLVKIIEAGRHAPRHQGGQGREAASLLPWRGDHRGARRLGREARRVSHARREIRQMARGHRYRRRHPELCLHQRQCACARPLRGALPGEDIVPIVEPEVLMDGDHDIDRCAEVTEFALKTLYRAALLRAGEARRHGAQAEHGGAGQEDRRSRPRSPRWRRRRCAC